MHKVISATTNPAKIQAILRAFEEIFGEGSCHIEPVAVESGVPEQPFGNQETRTGARNRVDNARRQHPQADFWVAIEAGIDDDATFSWVVIDNGTGAVKPVQPRCHCLLSFSTESAKVKHSAR